jgi:hypothetical protein
LPPHKNEYDKRPGLCTDREALDMRYFEIIDKIAESSVVELIPPYFYSSCIHKGDYHETEN